MISRRTRGGKPNGSLRKHQQGDMGSFTLETLAKQIKKEIEDSQATFEV
jgi:hypothetical protein